MRKIHGLIDDVRCRNHPAAYLLLPGQSDAGKEAGSKLNHASVAAGKASVRVEHGNSIANKRRICLVCD